MATTEGSDHDGIHRLEGDPFVCFRGAESEAGSAFLKGNVILCLTEPLTIKHFRLRLDGISRVSYVQTVDEGFPISLTQW